MPSLGNEPGLLQPASYPNESRSSFLLLGIALSLNCLAIPFAPFEFLAGVRHLAAAGDAVKDAVAARMLLAGSYSVVAFIALAVVLLAIDLRRLHSRFKGLDLVVVDPVLHAAIAGMSGLHSTAPPTWTITANPLDTNALTYGLFGRKQVVLGGGLRLLF